MIRHLLMIVAALAASGASAQAPRAPTADELFAINLGQSTIRSRMVAVPTFGPGVSAAAQKLAGCLDLDTTTRASGGTVPYMRTILNTCPYPIVMTAAAGKPRSYRPECDAVEPARTFALPAFTRLAIGQVPPERPGWDPSFYTYCIARIDAIGVPGPSVLPADIDAAQRLLAAGYGMTRGLLQYSRSDPDGDESRIVRSSAAAGRCKTRFDAAKVESRDGAPIRIKTEIDWTIPARPQIFSQAGGSGEEVSHRLYVNVNDGDRHPANPALWFDDLRGTLAAMQAVTVLAERCGGGG